MSFWEISLWNLLDSTVEKQGRRLELNSDWYWSGGNKQIQMRNAWQILFCPLHSFLCMRGPFRWARGTATSFARHVGVLEYSIVFKMTFGPIPNRRNKCERNTKNSTLRNHVQNCVRSTPESAKLFRDFPPITRTWRNNDNKSTWWFSLEKWPKWKHSELNKTKTTNWND